jgi:hypothetical protein
LTAANIRCLVFNSELLIFQVLQHLSVLIASKTLTFNVNLLESLQNVQTLHTPINQHLRVADYRQQFRTRTVLVSIKVRVLRSTLRSYLYKYRAVTGTCTVVLVPIIIQVLPVCTHYRYERLFDSTLPVVLRTSTVLLDPSNYSYKHRTLLALVKYRFPRESRVPNQSCL